MVNMQSVLDKFHRQNYYQRPYELHRILHLLLLEERGQYFCTGSGVFSQVNDYIFRVNCDWFYRYDFEATADIYSHERTVAGIQNSLEAVADAGNVELVARELRNLHEVSPIDALTFMNTHPRIFSPTSHNVLITPQGERLFQCFMRIFDVPCVFIFEFGYGHYVKTIEEPINVRQNDIDYIGAVIFEMALELSS